jgi:hypothetical protein
MMYEVVRPGTCHHEKYERLIAATRDIRAIPCAVAHPCDASSLGGVVESAQAGIVAPVLVGPRHKILAAACEAGLDLSLFETVDVPHSHAAAAKAVELVRAGRAELLMKGRLHTDELMHGVAHRPPEGRARECRALHGGRARPQGHPRPRPRHLARTAQDPCCLGHRRVRRKDGSQRRQRHAPLGGG